MRRGRAWLYLAAMQDEARATREFDVVVYGATGFTGRLVAKYLARTHPAAKWALGGRSLKKLEALRDELAAEHPALASLPLVVAQGESAASMRDMAARTRVLLTTVGPYATLGAPALAAALEGGCDYVDITGEPNFVRQSIEDNHTKAEAAGLRLVHCAGFDSIPHDVGVYETVKALQGASKITVNGYVRAQGAPSGGTWQSALDAMTKMRSRADARLPLLDHPGRTLRSHAPRLGYDKALGGWSFPLPTIDGQIVLRSASALPVYGAEFSYAHHGLTKSAPLLVGGALGLGALALAAQVGPARRWLQSLRPSGDGPSEATRAKSWFRCVFRGEGDGRTVVTTVSGGDPGYDETAKMLAETALGLALDRDALPPRYGVLSPVAALGDVLVTRLRNSGIRIVSEVQTG